MSLQPLTAWEGVRHNHVETLQGSWLYRLVMTIQRHVETALITLLSPWQASSALLGRKQEHSGYSMWQQLVMLVAFCFLEMFWGLVNSCFSASRGSAADQERGNTFFESV